MYDRLVAIGLLAGLGWLTACVDDAKTFVVHNDENAADYVVDPWWPGVLPNNWTVGQVAGIAVDTDDHIWLVHRPASITVDEAGAEGENPGRQCCIRAPAVLQLDATGNVLRAWGGPGDGYEWPEQEHGIHVDPQGNVWVGANGSNANHILKFTADGEFLLQIGRAGVSGGSNDTSNLGGAADMFVDGGEIYIADGYVNRRVIVFDANTGEYRRHWGAYGDVPSDGPLPPPDSNVPARQFRNPVHAVEVSRDGLVYVADRNGSRLQVFTRDGEFVTEVFILPETRPGSTWAIALSTDPDQRFLYVADGANYKIHVLRRADLQKVGEFGNHGRNAGMFGWVHNIAMDSRGNIYTSEVLDYKRVQRFVPQGR